MPFVARNETTQYPDKTGRGLRTVIAQATRILSLDSMRDVVSLLKPRLSGLVLVTTASGLWLAPGSLGFTATVATLFATAMIVGGANALNCYIERDADGKMHRTRSRPLPAGRLDSRVAVWLSFATLVVATPVLSSVANPLTALLGLVAFVLYVSVYTPLKYHSTWAVVVGAVPGAIPPLMGATAVTNTIEPVGLTLFAILLFWQLPHFLAISLYLKDDYHRGGMAVFAVVHGDRVTRLTIVLTAALMMPVTMAIVALDVAGMGYAIAAFVLNIGFLAFTLRGIATEDAHPWARRVFRMSIIYLPLLFVALIAGAH